MSKKHYMISDSISKSLVFAACTFMLILLTTVFVSAMRYGALEERVDNINCDKNINGIEERLGSHDVSIGVLNEHISNIDDNILEIKDLIKEIK